MWRSRFSPQSLVPTENSGFSTIQGLGCGNIFYIAFAAMASKEPANVL